MNVAGSGDMLDHGAPEALMEMMALDNARVDHTAGNRRLYQLMETCHSRKMLPDAAWERYRTVYEGRQAVVASISATPPAYPHASDVRP